MGFHLLRMLCALSAALSCSASPSVPISDVLLSLPQFSMFVAWVRQAGLEMMLSQPGAFTVFGIELLPL
jgi:uncharacterized surface protein with fasciclin (FAS1) repeats